LALRGARTPTGRQRAQPPLPRQLTLDVPWPVG
jgi:hypothetical protein